MSISNQPAVSFRRLHPRTWLLIAFALLLAGTLGYRWHSQQSTAPAVPGAGLAVTDPEVGAAIQTARDEVIRQPESSASWGKLAQVLHVHNYVEPAVTCYAEAGRRNPTNPDWPYLRSLIILVGDSPADALSDLKRAAEHERGERLARLRLGELFLDLGQPADAAEAFRIVLAIDPESPRAHLGLARLAALAQDWDGCLTHLAKVGNVPPALRQASLLRLAAFQRLGREADADRERMLIEQLPSADPLWPDSVASSLAVYQVGVRGRLQRSRQMLESGQTGPALDLLSETVALYPSTAACWTALGRCNAIAGDLQGAERALLRSVELSPDTADGWTSLGYVRWLQANYAGALEAYRNVIRLKPTDAEAHAKIGDCLMTTGDNIGAIEAYRTALRFDSQLREAQEKLKKLKALE